MSQGDKKHAATPQRLTDARRRGNVWKSVDLTSAASLLGSVLGFAMVGDDVVGDVRGMARVVWSLAGSGDVQVSALPLVLGRAMVIATASVVGLVLVMLACGVIVGFLQVRPLFTLDVLEPKFERLDPGENLRRQLGLEGIVELLKAIAKLLVVAGVCGWMVHDAAGAILRLGLATPTVIAQQMAGLALSLAVRVGVVLLVIGVLDAMFQRQRWLAKLRMTDTEHERAQKDQGQDPQTLRRRQQAREAVKHRAATLRTVTEWDVLTLNPTHLACALRYDPEQELAPRVLAKGRGQLAQDMIRAARARGVPIIRKKSLTRALFQLRVGSQIPRPLHAAVMLVLTWVEEDVAKQGRSPRWAKVHDQRAGSASQA
jgi:type III secretion protein U